MKIIETPLTDTVLVQLLAFSACWEAEDSCYGYRTNERADIEGSRIFLAEEDGQVIGYLFGRCEPARRSTSIMPDGTPCFEIEELYVRPEHRSRGVGGALFRHACDTVRSEATFITLSTATKNWRAILHFYIDEMGMDFWSARLFMKL